MKFTMVTAGAVLVLTACSGGPNGSDVAGDDTAALHGGHAHGIPICDNSATDDCRVLQNGSEFSGLADIKGAPGYTLCRITHDNATALGTGICADANDCYVYTQPWFSMCGPDEGGGPGHFPRYATCDTSAANPRSVCREGSFCEQGSATCQPLLVKGAYCDLAQGSAASLQCEDGLSCGRADPNGDPDTGKCN
jgi:hypothetical protein